jgi:hypothetical protein
VNCDAGKGLWGNVLSDAILDPAPIKRLVAKESSADYRYLARSVAVRSLACVILSEYLSARQYLRVQLFPLYDALIALLVDVGVIKR